MENILIVKFGALGDVIRTSYILTGLKRKYAGARVVWLTSPAAVDLLKHNPYIDQIATPAAGYDGLQEVLFDLVISLDDETEILRLLEGLSFRSVVGAFLADGVPSYDDRSAEWFDMGLISRFGKEQADSLKKENRSEHNSILERMLDISIDAPAFFNSPAVERKMALLFDRDFFNIGLNGGSGARWLSKQLPVNETVLLIDDLLSQSINGRQTCIYLLGGKDEEERNAEICSAFRSDRVRNPGCDHSLLEFAAIVKQCDYLITSDSLALHLAISQGVQNLSFYAPTSATEIGTFGTGVKLISTAADYCSYRRDADNSTITAERICALLASHIRFDTPGEPLTMAGGKR